MADKDRTEICNIISDMLDNPNEHEIYPTGTAYTRLEIYIESQRAEVLGWAIADACTAIDKGGDPRLMNVPDIFDRMKKDLLTPAPKPAKELENWDNTTGAMLSNH